MQTFTHTVMFAILQVCLFQGIESSMNKVSITVSELLFRRCIKYIKNKNSFNYMCSKNYLDKVVF